MENPLDLLGVPTFVREDARREGLEVLKSYLKSQHQALMRQYHPDRGGAGAQERATQITQLFAELSDTETLEFWLNRGKTLKRATLETTAVATDGSAVVEGWKALATVLSRRVVLDETRVFRPEFVEDCDNETRRASPAAIVTVEGGGSLCERMVEDAYVHADGRELNCKGTVWSETADVYDMDIDKEVETQVVYNAATSVLDGAVFLGFVPEAIALESSLLHSDVTDDNAMIGARHSVVSTIRQWMPVADAANLLKQVRTVPADGRDYGVVYHAGHGQVAHIGRLVR